MPLQMNDDSTSENPCNCENPLKLSLWPLLDEETLELKLKPEMFTLLVDVGKTTANDDDYAAIAVHNILSDYLTELPEE